MINSNTQPSGTRPRGARDSARQKIPATAAARPRSPRSSEPKGARTRAVSSSAASAPAAPATAGRPRASRPPLTNGKIRGAAAVAKRRRVRPSAALLAASLRATASGTPASGNPPAPAAPRLSFPLQLAAATGEAALPAVAAPSFLGARRWLAPLAALPGRVASAFSALRRGAGKVGRVARRPRRDLRLCEMLPLSEKRFLAVVRYGDAQFLIGGAQNSITLLSALEGPAAEGAAAPWAAGPSGQTWIPAAAGAANAGPIASPRGAALGEASHGLC